MSVLEPATLAFERLTQHHLEAILEIEREAYPEPWTPVMFMDEIRNNRSYFFVAFEGPALVGYCGFWLVLDEAHVTTVVVRKQDRGRGVGRRLFGHLMEQAESAGATMATLEVRTSNQAAQRLYESYGFQSVGLRRGYYPKTREDAIVMLREFGRRERD